MLSGVICDQKVPIKVNRILYCITIRPVILYGTKCQATKCQEEHKCGKDKNVALNGWELGIQENIILGMNLFEGVALLRKRMQNHA